MLKKRINILIIGHDASLSGAPVLLLHLCGLLQKQKNIRLHIVIRRGGPLVDEFKKLGKITVLKSSDYGKEASLSKRIESFLLNKKKLVKLMLETSRSHVIFSNTIVNGKLLKLLSIYGLPIVTYVHELESVIQYFIKQGDAGYSLSHSRLLAYPSKKVREVLMASHHIHGQKLKRLSYYFPFDPNRYSQEDAKNHRAAFRKAHGIRDDEFLVVGMGLVSDRKGTDLFIEVCEQIVRKNVAIKFCWIGAFESNALEAIIREQVKEKGLEQHIIFTGPLKPHFYNLSPFDLFFLSSREDPYPLVVLEAALMKLPSVCFSPSGGIVEFVSTDAGWVINGFSATAAANEIIKLSNKPWVLKEFGIQAFKKVMQWHCNPELIMSEFTSIIDSLHLKHK